MAVDKSQQFWSSRDRKKLLFKKKKEAFFVDFSEVNNFSPLANIRVILYSGTLWSNAANSASLQYRQYLRSNFDHLLFSPRTTNNDLQQQYKNESFSLKL